MTESAPAPAIGEPRVLKPSQRWLILLFIIFSMDFALDMTKPLSFEDAVGFLFCLLLLAMILPGSRLLRLEATGFEEVALFRSRWRFWRECSAFLATNRAVSFDDQRASAWRLWLAAPMGRPNTRLQDL